MTSYPNTPTLRALLQQYAAAHHQKYVDCKTFDFDEKQTAMLDKCLADVKWQIPALEHDPIGQLERAIFRTLTSTPPDPKPKKPHVAKRFLRKLGLGLVLALLLVGAAQAAPIPPAYALASWDFVLAQLNSPQGGARGGQPVGVAVGLMNGASVLATRYGGLFYIKCSTNMTCSWSGNVFTMTSTGGAGSGCTPGGATDEIQANDGAGGCIGIGGLGTTSTILHGNAAGLGAFGKVVSADLNITGTTCTNQFVRNISSAAAGTCASVANADLSNASTTVNTNTCTLGGSCTIGLGQIGNPAATTTFSYANNQGATVNLLGTATSAWTTDNARAQFLNAKNTTAAIVGTSQGSPEFSLCGRAFHGSADVEDCFKVSELPGNGNDAAITVNYGHSGTSTGAVTHAFSGAVQPSSLTASLPVCSDANKTLSSTCTALIPSADLNLTTTTCTNQFVTAISATAAGTCTTDTLASAQHANQGTTVTVLHGNGAGNPAFGSVVSADLNITTTTCTNQFLTAISATGTGTCTTATLAGAQFANQGTTTTVLHGNGAGNPSFAAVALASDVSGQLPIGNVGSAGLSATSPVTIASTGVIACATCTVTVANGTSAMGTGAISSATCATVVTTSATGTATTDNIMADFNADPHAVTGYVPSASGMLTIIKYPTANNVNFLVCNNTSGSITPGAITLNWRVVR